MSVSTTADIITTQKKALVETIKVAERTELMRMKKLSLVTTSGERESLSRRFERERLQDQDRISNLTNDLFVLSQKVAKGEPIRAATEHRSRSPSHHSSSSSSSSKHNRFFGLESHGDLLFFDDIVKKFDRHDVQFTQRSSRPTFDSLEEHRKLRLLTEKRDVLRQLVAIHNSESHARSDRSSSNSNSDAYSVTSRTNTSSNYSYATFGSSTVNKLRTVDTRKHNVPQLNLRLNKS